VLSKAAGFMSAKNMIYLASRWLNLGQLCLKMEFFTQRTAVSDYIFNWTAWDCLAHGSRHNTHYCAI